MLLDKVRKIDSEIQSFGLAYIQMFSSKAKISINKSRAVKNIAYPIRKGVILAKNDELKS